jgi:predicted transcriptional regulator
MENERLYAKSKDELSGYEKRRLRNNQKPVISSVEAVALLWSAVILPGTVHGFNGGTNEDQVKILMKNEWERNKKSEFTIAEILDIWNYRKHGKPHTRQQAVNAIQSLRAKGIVSVTEHQDRSKGKSHAKYALTKVLEEMTEPVVEDTEKEGQSPVEIAPGHYFQSDTPVASIEETVLTAIGSLGKEYKANINALIEMFEKYDSNVVSYDAAFKQLVVEIAAHRKVTTEIQNHNVEAFKQNTTEFVAFSDRTNENFAELESYYGKIVAFMGDAIARLEQIYRITSNPNTVAKASSNEWRDGYKEGFKDGRADYRSELTVDSVKKELD